MRDTAIVWDGEYQYEIEYEVPVREQDVIEDIWSVTAFDGAPPWPDGMGLTDDMMEQLYDAAAEYYRDLYDRHVDDMVDSYRESGQYLY